MAECPWMTASKRDSSSIGLLAGCGAYLVQIVAAVFFAAPLVACADDEPASARSRSRVEHPAGSDCIDEFVQEFEEVAQDPPRETPPSLCFAEHSPADGPPKYPATSRKVRIEYQRGDYFVTQDRASWILDEPESAGGCLVAKLVRTR